MKSSRKFYKTLCIDIITYKSTTKKHSYKKNQIDNNMNVVSLDKNNNTPNKFMCSICLNQKCGNGFKELELDERKSRSCPICQCTCSYSTDNDSNCERSKESENYLIDTKNIKVAKDVQTSDANVTQGLSLLNEVLNVFQNKKSTNYSKEKQSRTVIFKDVAVSTEDRYVYRKTRPKLSISKIFVCSIEEKNGNENKFTIINSTQPDRILPSHKSHVLINHKSSSIPQMKLEELKNSLKEKTKSKDAIEEANRIFATMKRAEEKDADDNRPVVRSGPRVLPVVKTANINDNQTSTHRSKPKMHQSCKSCLENNYNMSSGDSTIKNKCSHNCNACSERCDDCIYMMCCHYKKSKQQTKELICSRCRLAKQGGSTKIDSRKLNNFQ